MVLMAPSCQLVAMASSCNLSNLGGGRRHHVDTATLAVERHHAGGQGEQGVVLAAADIPSGLIARAALADDDAAGQDGLPTVDLHAQPLAVRLAPVPAGTLTFLMCHCYLTGALFRPPLTHGKR